MANFSSTENTAALAQAAVTIPMTGWLKQQKLISHNCGGCQLDIRVPAKPDYDKNLPLGLQVGGPHMEDSALLSFFL